MTDDQRKIFLNAMMHRWQTDSLPADSKVREAVEWYCEENVAAIEPIVDDMLRGALK